MSSDDVAKTLPLSRFHATLASPRAAKRVDALISADNAKEVVQALTVTDLYHLINEVGLDDCVELVGLCSSEQVQGCVDMEIWDRDLPQIEAFLPWLAVLREAGFEHFGEIWAGLDPELAALTLSRLTLIYDKSLDEEVPDEEERDYFETPDTFFQVVLTSVDENHDKLVHAIIEDLYRADMVLAQHTLMAARSEPVAELEESSYRWRSGRMADQGYVEFYEALEVFRPLDPATVTIGEGSRDGIPAAPSSDKEPIVSELPVPMLEQVIGRSFLAKCLQGIDDTKELERLQGSLLFVVNRVMSAGRLNPGDRDALELAALHAMSSVALGLEHISGGELDAGVQTLQSVSLTRLHRVGYTLTLRVARFAKMIAPQALTAGEPSIQVLEALLGKRPFFPVVLEEAGSAQVRPIESRKDIATIAEHLRILALRTAIATALDVDLLALAQKEEPRPQLDDFARTALLHATLGDDIATTPLTAADLGRFRSDTLQDGAMSPDTRRDAYDKLLAVLDAAGVSEARDALPKLVDSWFDELDQTFAGLPLDKPIEAKFLGGLRLADAMA